MLIPIVETIGTGNTEYIQEKTACVYTHTHVGTILRIQPKLHAWQASILFLVIFCLFI